MPITIKNPAPPASPHQAAADAIKETVTEESQVTTSETGEVIGHESAHDTELELVAGPALTEKVGVTMGFKMPVAPYTMTEFRVTRTTMTNDPDGAFTEVKDWVEARVNQLVEEQQAALPENAQLHPQM